jgi:glutathione synthase/RimK-type ligase-like ATP-grasp enzyme
MLSDTVPLTLAIQPDHTLLTSGRYQSFSIRWAEQIQRAGHRVREVDVLRPGLREQLLGCDGFMWWFPHMTFPRNCAKRVIAAVDHVMGMHTFPDLRTIWHFDDKIAQYYVLSAAAMPMPRTWTFWREEEALEFCRTASYPLVIKLSGGIVSENVRLLKSYREAAHWIQRLFRGGVVTLHDPNRSTVGKAYQRVRSAARMLIRGTGESFPRRFELQRDYLLVQEFLPGNGFDTRITVIGNRAFGFRRFNRPDDFRASGSGRIDWNPAAIDHDSVRLAFTAAQQLRTQSLAVDVLRREGKPVLTEISYYYEAWAVQACPGHWVLQGDAISAELQWVDGEMRPEDAILEDFLECLEVRS